MTNTPSTELQRRLSTRPWHSKKTCWKSDCGWRSWQEYWNSATGQKVPRCAGPVKINRLVSDCKLKLQLLFLHSSVSVCLSLLSSPPAAIRHGGTRAHITSSLNHPLWPPACRRSSATTPPLLSLCCSDSWLVGNSIQFIWLGMVTAPMLLGIRDKDWRWHRT